MKKINWLIYGIITILVTAGWFTYQSVTADTHEEMSIIPEQHKDVPMFDGLVLRNREYVMEGNHWNEIFGFYLKELPRYGWEIEYQQTSFDENNDIAGFLLEGRKKGLDWGLSIYGSYFEMNNQTEVTFDKTPIYHSTTWIRELPNDICIYETLNQEDCLVIEDKSKHEKIKKLINKAIDWEKDKLPNGGKTSLIVFGNIEIKVYYGKDKEIYFESEKGVKLMKPELEFFELTNLSQ